MTSRAARRNPARRASRARPAWALLLVLGLVALLPACGDAPVAPDGDPAGAAPAGSAPDAADPDLRDPSLDPSLGQGLDQDVIDQLRALGYVDVVEPGDVLEGRGVRHADPARMSPGLTYYTSAHGCSSYLVDAQGRTLRSWSLKPCDKWDNTTLLPDGDVLTVLRGVAAAPDAAGFSEARRLVRVGYDDTPRWDVRIPVHHDVEQLPDGRIAALTYTHRVIPEIDPEVPVRDDAITLFSPTGEALETVSLVDVLLASPEAFTIQPVKPRDKDGLLELDLPHANSLEWMRRPELADQDPLYDLGNVLVCLRNQDAVLILDWDARRVLWSWGQGEISGPHDATLLDSGNVLLFDNGLGRRWSRVVEVDPRTDEIVWSYGSRGPGRFYTAQRGAAERLENGNTLITESAKGHVFEVTPEGDVVWDFVNPDLAEDGRPIIIVRARRVLPGGDGVRFRRSD